MHEFLIDLGLKKYDIALLILCPFGAVLGSFAHAILQIINPHKMPQGVTFRLATNLEALGRMRWLVLRLTLGAILGLVVGLYFVGALQENVTTLAKVVALSVLLGYAAPKVWIAQERIVVDQSMKRLNELLRHREEETGPKSEPAKPLKQSQAVSTDSTH